MSEATRVAAVQEHDSRSDHDFTHLRAKRRYADEYGFSAPPGALPWQPDRTSENAKLLRRWRLAVLWKFRRDSVVRVIACLIMDYAGMRGFAFPHNKTMAEVSFISRPRIDKALTRLEKAGAIIRVWEREHPGLDDDDGKRRIYPATAIIAEFENTVEKRRS